MGRDKRNENRSDQFTKWIRSETRLPAWRALSSSAKAAYMHFKVRCRTEGKNLKFNNNGRVALSARVLASEMGCTPRTAMSAMADLQAKGWVICTKLHQLGTEGKGRAPEWRLTMLPCEEKGKGTVQPTTEPKQWAKGKDYAVIEYKSSKRSGHAPGDATRFQG